MSKWDGVILTLLLILGDITLLPFCIENLMLSALGKVFCRHRKYFPYFSHGDNLHEMSNSFFWEKWQQAIMICQKTWPPGGGSYFPYISIEKTLKFFLSETTGQFSVTWQECCFGTLFQDCSSHHDMSKNMPARGHGLFSLYIYNENFKMF